MRYATKLSDCGDRMMLSIIIDGQEAARFYDGGEPEDNTFWRKWNWISSELERAYRKGLEDAKP